MSGEKLVLCTLTKRQVWRLAYAPALSGGWVLSSPGVLTAMDTLDPGGDAPRPFVALLPASWAEASSPMSSAAIAALVERLQRHRQLAGDLTDERELLLALERLCVHLAQTHDQGVT